MHGQTSNLGLDGLSCSLLPSDTVMPVRYNVSMDKRKIQGNERQDGDQIHQIRLNGGIIPYKMIPPRPHQVRIILRWQDGILCVSAPRGTPEATIQSAIERNCEWVLARQQASSLLHIRPLVPGDSICLLGMPWSIRLAGRIVGPDSLHRCIYVPEAPPSSQHEVLYTLIKQMAAEVLPKRAWELANAHGLLPDNVRVREQKSRWGSCSSKRNIQLNWRLIQAPEWICDYVIIHELAHLREMNHSARFWSIVESILPNWQEARNWLKQYGDDLFRLRADGWVQF
ncbi:hypothetical protein Alches_10280 [Alicyclobacillus hesperidum subsp. aegles]|uniref:M48 family metallopeptidase n=1 Tax=Alicyclobacillus hesperidum TaxID=89784 RepID=UPI00222A755F|nr:SprT family zinc-dependent metalloprotease [Alicyclobacillus hesperidum]GLG00989.1 hypothetical protein Alches_10280 [Alicyclobacillus hesperidum subsp. aegles]